MSLVEEHLKASFGEVILPDDEVVCVLSRISTFAHKLGWPIREVPTRILNVLEEYVGPEKTIVMPSFFGSFPRTKAFDLTKSRPETGAIPQSAVGRAGYVRTKKPMTNFIAKGPEAERISELPCTTAWGDDSVFGWLHAKNARIVLLGIHDDNYGWLLLHRAEEICQVPYRYYKRFAGELFDNGRKLGSLEEVLFVGPWHANVEHDHSIATFALREQGAELVAGNEFLSVRSGDARRIVEGSVDALRKDPLAYIRNRGEIEQWIEYGKAEEIAELEEEARWP